MGPGAGHGRHGAAAQPGARRRGARADLLRPDLRRRGGGAPRPGDPRLRRPARRGPGLAAEIAGKNPHAIRAAKRLLNLAAEADQHEILLEESREQTALIGSPNQVEAVRANLEKRAPNFAEAEVETPAPAFGAS